MELRSNRADGMLPIGSGTSSSTKPAGNTNNRSELLNSIEPYPLHLRAPKIEFPVFDGYNLNDWVYKAEQYFELDLTPDDWKVRVAVMYFEGKALKWYHAYTQNFEVVQVVKWGELVKDLHLRFGEKAYEDPMAELKELQQEGELQEYLEEFEHLTTQVKLPENYLVSCFISGLHPSIQ